MKKYWKFLLMIGVSTVVMLSMMHLSAYTLDHIFFSHTRIFVVLMMGAVMAVIILLLMWKTCEDKKIDVMILAASLPVFAGFLFMIRSQTTVNDTAWMKAMIPHHSITTLTSKRVDLKDPEVKELAGEIIRTQGGEINKMKKVIEEME